MPPSRPSGQVSLGVPADSRGRSREFASRPTGGSRKMPPDEMCAEVFPLYGSHIVPQLFFSTYRPGLSSSVNPYMPAGYLMPEFGSSIKSISDFALASRLRARWCALRSRRNDTLTDSSRSSTSFGRLLGCPTGAGARLGSIADATTVRMDAACAATSAACAVDACMITRFASCALRAWVAAAAACVAALAARTASFNCACCSLTNWPKNSTPEPSVPTAPLPGTTGGVTCPVFMLQSSVRGCFATGSQARGVSPSSQQRTSTRLFPLQSGSARQLSRELLAYNEDCVSRGLAVHSTFSRRIHVQQIYC